MATTPLKVCRPGRKRSGRRRSGSRRRTSRWRVDQDDRRRRVAVARVVADASRRSGLFPDPLSDWYSLPAVVIAPAFRYVSYNAPKPSSIRSAEEESPAVGPDRVRRARLPSPRNDQVSIPSLIASLKVSLNGSWFAGLAGWAFQ